MTWDVGDWSGIGVVALHSCLGFGAGLGWLIKPVRSVNRIGYSLGYALSLSAFGDTVQFGTKHRARKKRSATSLEVKFKSDSPNFYEIPPLTPKIGRSVRG